MFISPDKIPIFVSLTEKSASLHIHPVHRLGTWILAFHLFLCSRNKRKDNQPNNGGVRKKARL